MSPSADDVHRLAVESLEEHKSEDLACQMEDGRHVALAQQAALESEARASFIREYNVARGRTGGCSLTFVNVSYVVPHTGKRVLTGITGHVDSGQLVGVLGTSGSGKTTLLTILSQPTRRSAGLTGDILIRGVRPWKSSRRETAFVFQDDLALSNLTKLPRSFTRSQCLKSVDAVIRILKLGPCADSRVGSTRKRGISGGERKRMALGMALVARPSILYLDEPTSSLDSSSALSLILLLKDLCATGLLIMSSIHQPMSDIYKLFDKVMLMSRGSAVCYGRPDECLSYFEGLGWPLPPFTNPADFLLSLVDEGVDGSGYGRSSELIQAFRKQQDLAAEKMKHLDLDGETREQSQHVSTDAVEGRDSRNGLRSLLEFLTLLERAVKQRRGELFSAVNVLQLGGLAVIVTCLWWQTREIDNVQGALFFIILSCAFISMSNITSLFPAERNLMSRERSSGMYRVLPYYVAKCLSDVELSYVVPGVYVTIVYWTIGLRPSLGAYGTYLAIIFSAITTAQSMGLLFSTSMPDVQLSASVTVMLWLLCMLLGGFYVPTTQIPPAFAWMKNLSFLYWGFSALLLNEFRHRDFACSSARPGQYGTICPIAGETVITSRGIHSGQTVAGCILALWVLSVVMRTASYVLLRVLVKPTL